MTQSSTILLWHDAHKGDPCGAAGLLGWRSFARRPADELYSPYGEPAQIGAMARTVLGDAFRRGVNCYVGWQSENPETTPAAEVEAAVQRLWPVTIFAPARSADSDRWVMGSFGEAAVLAKGAVERTITEFLAAHIPTWSPGVQFRPHALVVRVDTTAEALGLIEPHKPTPDEIVASCGSDQDVATALSRWDRASPATWRDLVRARLVAQARAGIAEVDRAPLYSGQVDDFLVPIVMRMWKGDAPAVLSFLRRDLGRVYGDDLGEFVLQFMLRSYSHSGAEELLALATGAREAA
jgi:hypothetical protein